jgi:hypothetical protein
MSSSKESPNPKATSGAVKADAKLQIFDTEKNYWKTIAIGPRKYILVLARRNNKRGKAKYRTQKRC